MRKQQIFSHVGIFGLIFAGPLRGQTEAARLVQAYTVSGIVLDDARRPVPSAELTVSQKGRVTRVVRTDQTGTFRVDNLAEGLTSFLARRLGYKARTATLTVDGTTATAALEIVLEAVPADVAPVVVSANNSRLKRFNEDRQHNGFGHFMDHEQIEKRGVRLTSDLLRMIPGAYVKSSGRFGNLVRLRGCRPKLWLDGAPVDAELDEVTTPGEIAGIEIYPSAPSVPSEYMDQRGCGVIVIWTRL